MHMQYYLYCEHYETDDKQIIVVQSENTYVSQEFIITTQTNEIRNADQIMGHDQEWQMRVRLIYNFSR